MPRDFVLQLRYIGVFPQNGHREYRFHIDKGDQQIREVALTIDDGLFTQNHLMFQEAPDLCYQKLLLDLRNESDDAPIGTSTAVTSSDIAVYRDSHPTSKTRRVGSRAAAAPAAATR
jgi:hypothetical protein